MHLIIMVLLPIVAGLIISLFSNRSLQRVGDGGRFILVLLSSYNLYKVLNHGTISIRMKDVALLGIGLLSDRVSSVLLLMTSLIFFVIGLYIIREIELDNTFHFLFLTMQAILYTAFLSIDIFNLFVLLELATLICGILIMYLREKRSAYDGLTYILLNTVAIMFYLIGVGLLYKIFGNLDLSFIQEQVAEVDSEELILAVAFILTGLLFKSACFPLSFWLPRAHGTPGAHSAVSAMLSGVFIKISLYLLIRYIGLFEGVLPLRPFILWIATITSILGIVLAILTKDVKLILANHTISQIGLILIGIVSSGPQGYYGGLLHIVNHAFFKSLLFLTIGLIVEKYKSRRISDISGVFRYYPLLGVCLLVGILGITGAPLFNGFTSKYLIAYDYKNTFFQWVIELINLGTILSFVKLGSILFETGKSVRVQRIPMNQQIALVISAVLVFGSGLFAKDIVHWMTGETLILSFEDFLVKALTWLGYLVLATLIYLKVLPKLTLYQKGVRVDVSFHTMVGMIIVTFTVIVCYFLLMTSL
ncbi:hypothetical protein HZY91_10475 [Facklamia sp. DSM 111018]|uniref:NADH:quinone oxidoreductase/Mrp antiporter transmembrane domain-containing protein n=1 Tax=Facklamia lactis TaxID=2749967 RepID=A0ABS0LSZ6_9LACT|nr:proton-conducting transporter membrane subunit [Facklamia lactis]MBG9987291.1 hypothetical protein [Facklamia lactis]